METIDRTTLQQWLDWDADGELAQAEKIQLEVHLAANPELQAEGVLLRSLHRGLAADRIPVREGFRKDTMDALPMATWERGRAAWRLPLAVMLSFSAAAAWLLAGTAPAHPVFGTGMAIVDFLQASALAGAGLLTASWRGLGMALEDLFTGLDVGFFALVALVICLDLLLVSMLRRRSPRKLEAARAEVAANEADPIEAAPIKDRESAA